MFNLIRKLSSALTPYHVSSNHSQLSNIPCIGTIRGQHKAKQALLIAASGSHNLLLIGPPGEGKSYLASTLPGILPTLTRPEARELIPAYSLVPSLALPRPSSPRPYRAIGPTITPTGLLGGGRGKDSIYPGELALAHSGALFIDELPQYGRSLIDSLRQPLESGELVVSRGGRAIHFPCRSLILSAMNTCPCGKYPDSSCECSPSTIERYQNKVSGPILDRIDLFVELQAISSRDRLLPAIEQQSKGFLLKVTNARIMQLRRNPNQILNSQLGPRELLNCPEDYFSREGLDTLSSLSDAARFSTRRFIRIARVSRTIADIVGVELIKTEHVRLAFSYATCPLLGMTSD